MKTEKDTVLKHALYCRKSSESEDRQVLSLDSQEDEGRELAEKLSIKLRPDRVFKESKSAKTAGTRPLFGHMIKLLDCGEINAIVTWHPDRTSRNALDAAKLITLMDEGKLIEIVTPMQTFRNTPSDKFFFNFLCSQAKMENDKKGIDVMRGLHKKAKLGACPIQAPIGYKNIGERGDRTIIADPDRFEHVQLLFQWLLSGQYTPMQILAKANDELGLTNNRTGKKVSRSTLYYMFHNPFYYAEFEYPRGSGDWYFGTYTPAISKEQYYQIQAILGNKAHPFSKRPKDMFPFRDGKLRCGECKAAITAEEKVKRTKGGNVHRYIYYHCTRRVNPNCSQKSIRSEKLETAFLDILKEIEIPRALHRWAIKELKKMNADEVRNRGSIIGSARKGYDSTVVQLNKLIDLRLSNEITEEELRDRKLQIESRKKHYRAVLEDSDKRIDDWIDTAERCFDFANKARLAFETGTSETKTHILGALGSNFYLKDNILSIHWIIPFSAIRGMAEEARTISARLEPGENPVKQEYLEEKYTHSSALLRG